jgi:putative transposase
LARWSPQNGVIKEDQRLYPKISPSNKLTLKERAKVISIATSKQYVDLPPCQIIPKLVDKNYYIASESSFYRILKQEQLAAHRGKSKQKSRKKPTAYVAKNPNEIWSWDITYLQTSIRGEYFYLYMILDIFSRKIVGYEVYEVESAEHAATVAKWAYKAERIDGKSIVLHSDNGSPMKGATMLAMLQELGVVPSFSRASVSNDNPYSEAAFKTLKYCPQFPSDPFVSLEAARDWCSEFVTWYNTKHCHSKIKFVTPSERHQSLDKEILDNRKNVYERAKSRNPSRWSKNIRNWDRIEEVHLNPGKGKQKVA